MTRRYRSPLRAEQALLTRRRILDVAQSRFLESGWAATTMKGIADEASVAPTTVYAVFGSKRALISALIDEALTGLAEPDNLDWWADAIRHPDQGERARRLVQLICGFLPRVAPLERVVREAAGADGEVASLARDLLQWRQAAVAAVVKTLAGEEGLSLSREDVADLLFALAGPEVYSLLVEVRGWSSRQFETYLTTMVDRFIDRPPARNRRPGRVAAPKQKA
ncbi:MAG: TetR/AcrR family transcriptional regulator [Acidimicrobiia bacterium]